MLNSPPPEAVVRPRP